MTTMSIASIISSLEQLSVATLLVQDRISLQTVQLLWSQTKAPYDLNVAKVGLLAPHSTQYHDIRQTQYHDIMIFARLACQVSPYVHFRMLIPDYIIPGYHGMTFLVIEPQYHQGISSPQHVDIQRLSSVPSSAAGT